MSLVPMSELSGGAKAWIFGSPKPLETYTETIRDAMTRFIGEWTAHGADLPAAFEIVEGRFVAVAADDEAQPGGCSIDRLFDLMKAFEKELGLPMLDSTLVFYRDSSGTVRSATRAEFRALTEEGSVDGETSVFDTAIDRVDDFRRGLWEKSARDSWHGAAFGLK